jgi:hypothetical protein
MDRDTQNDALDTSDEETVGPLPTPPLPIAAMASRVTTNPMSPGPPPPTIRSSPLSPGPRRSLSAVQQSVDRPPSTNASPQLTSPPPHRLQASQSFLTPPPTVPPVSESPIPSKRPGVLGRSISLSSLAAGSSGNIRTFRKSMAKVTGVRGLVSGKKDGAADDGAGSSHSLPNSPITPQSTNERLIDIVVKGNRLGVALTNAKDDGCLFVDM